MSATVWLKIKSFADVFLCSYCDKYKYYSETDAYYSIEKSKLNEEYLHPITIQCDDCFQSFISDEPKQKKRKLI